MIHLRLLAALLFLAAPATAKAVDLECAKADTQAALNLCAAKELEAADKDLSRVRKELSKKIDNPAAKGALDEAEKARTPIAMRNAHSNLVASLAPTPNKWSLPIARCSGRVPVSRS